MVEVVGMEKNKSNVGAATCNLSVAVDTEALMKRVREVVANLILHPGSSSTINVENYITIGVDLGVVK
jgi:hypothetical protein